MCHITLLEKEKTHFIVTGNSIVFSVVCISNESTEKRIELLQLCLCAHTARTEHTQSLWSAASFIHFKWYIVKYLARFAIDDEIKAT